jgi:hypothetical protein
MRNKYFLLSVFLLVSFVFFGKNEVAKASDCTDCQAAYGSDAATQCTDYCGGAMGGGGVKSMAEVCAEQGNYVPSADGQDCVPNTESAGPTQVANYLTQAYCDQYAPGTVLNQAGDDCIARRGGTGDSSATMTTQEQNLADMSNGTCNFNSDCGVGFTCYQKACVDDATYKENVSLLSRAGNTITQTFTTGGSVFSSGGTASNSTLATITKAASVNGVSLPIGSKVMTDGSVVDSKYNQILPAGSVSTSSLSNLISQGSLPGNTNLSKLVNGASSTNYVPGPKCGANFQDIGGVCFPTNTGLANPQGGILQILGNLFSWLMALFSIFAIVAFVISGIQYLLSAGDEDLAKSAKKNANNAILGIVIGLSGFIIIKAISAALAGQGYFF